MIANIMRVVKSSPAVEHGFLAAGVTISVAAAVQSIAIVMSWILSIV